MEKDKINNNDNENLPFLKVDQLKRGSHAMSLLLRTDDKIVALNKILTRSNQKTLNQKLKENDENFLTILRRNVFFTIKAEGPLGIKLKEVDQEESKELLDKTHEYLKEISDYNSYNEFEVYRGEKNLYNEIQVNELSLLASLLPFVWFFHHKLYTPLFLLVGTLLLLGSIAWWLFLTAWVIITIYMTKSSLSLLRGYCLFNEMKIYMRIYAKSNQEVQKTIRLLDKKSNYIFPLIGPPVENIEQESSINKNTEKEELSKAQAQTI